MQATALCHALAVTRLGKWEVSTHNKGVERPDRSDGSCELITHEEIIELGKKYGFSEAVLGYSDTEKMLLIFAMQIYARGYNDAVKTTRELAFWICLLRQMGYVANG